MIPINPLSSPNKRIKSNIEDIGGYNPWGYSSLVLVGMCRCEIESRPIQIQIPTFQEKVTHSYTNWPNFWAQFWAYIIAWFFQNSLKFEPILKNWPIYTPNSAFYKGHSYTKRLILLPMLMACPHRVFCTEYSPPPSPRAITFIKTGNMFSILRTSSYFYWKFVRLPIMPFSIQFFSIQLTVISHFRLFWFGMFW